MNTLNILNIKFYFEEIISEIYFLIENDPDCPKMLNDYYKQLKSVSRDIEIIIAQNTFSIEEIISEMDEIYQDMIDKYYDSIETTYGE